MPPKTSQKTQEVNTQSEKKETSRSDNSKKSMSQEAQFYTKTDEALPRDSSDQTINKNKNDTFFNKSWLSKSKYNQHYGVLKKGVDDYHIICACSPFSEIRCGSWQNHKTRNQIHLNWIAKNPPEDIEYLEQAIKLNRSDLIFQYRIKLGILCAKNNLSFNVTENIVQFFEDQDLVKEILQDSSTNKRNIQSMICDCIAPFLEKQLNKIIEDKCFVFFVDGWSDRQQCHLSVCLRFWDSAKGIQNIFFDDKSYLGQGSGEKEFGLINQSLLQKYGQKALQFVADGGMGTLIEKKNLVNQGRSRSVAGYIKNNYQHIEIQHCMDHQIDLINHKAFKKVPQEIKDIIRAIPSKIRTAQSKDYLRKLYYEITLEDWITSHQQEGNYFISEQIESLNFNLIPSFCETRWYGNFTLISRILQNYQALIEYFSSQQYKDEKIVEILKKPDTRLYLEFLKLFLQKTLRYIELLQQDHATLVEAQKYMDDMIIQFSSYFLINQLTETKDRYDIDYSQIQIQNQVFHSQDVIFSQILLRHRKDLKINYLENQLFFYSQQIVQQKQVIDFMIVYIQTILIGIKKYYGTSKERIKSLLIIYPTQKIDITDAQYWLDKYENRIIPNNMEQEIHSNIYKWNMKIDEIREIFIKKYDKNLNNFYLDDQLNSEFPYLMHLIQQLLIMIPSSAYNERVHSILRIIRNYHRQQLLFPTVKQILMVKCNHDIIDLENQETITQIQTEYDLFKKAQAPVQPQNSNKTENRKRLEGINPVPGIGPTTRRYKKLKPSGNKMWVGDTPACVKIAEYHEEDDREESSQHEFFNNLRISSQEQIDERSAPNTNSNRVAEDSSNKQYQDKSQSINLSQDSSKKND